MAQGFALAFGKTTVFPVGKGQFIEAKAERSISPQNFQHGQPVFAGLGEINGIEWIADNVGVAILAVDAETRVIRLLPDGRP